MKTLLLLLRGPLQSWGDSSRFSRRSTRHEPTKSGVIGLLAAAQGRRRVDPVEDLARLRFAVRVDQRGRLMRDFHTARSLDGARIMPLSERYYLADAAFVAAIEGDDQLIEVLAGAVQEPAFPLYLGRRSCAPSDPIFLAVREQEALDALRDTPWQASDWYRRQQGRSVDLEVVADAAQGEVDVESIRDLPQSFDPRRRLYGWRQVGRERPITVDNPLGKPGMDFFAALGGR